MNYLFFDIECSDGRHMCSFGYVLCDSQFNILKKEDILINPEAPFRLARAGFDPKIQLGYPKEKFYAAPNFVARYDKIKRILEAKNQLVMGHSVLNDVNFLQIACERYSKPDFEYSFFDEQQVYKTLNEGKSVATALEKIAEVYGIEPESLHRSDDDAVTTMKIVQRICQDLNMTPEQLEKEYPLSLGKVENGIIKRFVLDPYKWYALAVFDIGKNDKSGKNKKSEANAGEQSNAQVKDKKNKFFFGKKFCFATKLERTIPLKMYSVVKMICERGGEYTDNPAECQVFVKHKNGKCHRTNYALAHKNIKVVPFEQLLDLIGIKYADIVPYDFKGGYVGKKPKPIETGVSHIEKTPTSIGDHIKTKDSKKPTNFKRKRKFSGKRRYENGKKNPQNDNKNPQNHKKDSPNDKGEKNESNKNQNNAKRD